MLCGEYILHELVEVFGVVSLSLYGSRPEVNGSAREKQVVINCENGEGGIGFTTVTDLHVSVWNNNGLLWSTGNKKWLL